MTCVSGDSAIENRSSVVAQADSPTFQASNVASIIVTITANGGMYASATMESGARPSPVAPRTIVASK